MSYVPNLRLPLWSSSEEAKNMIVIGLPYADVLKISEEEFQFITAYIDLEKGTDYLYKEYGISLVFVTRGKQGCFYRIKDFTGSKEGIKVAAVVTTGAGDDFSWWSSLQDS